MEMGQPGLNAGPGVCFALCHLKHRNVTSWKPLSQSLLWLQARLPSAGHWHRCHLGLLSCIGRGQGITFCFFLDLVFRIWCLRLRFMELYFHFLKDLIYSFLEKEREGDRGRETSVCGCLLCAPYWGPVPKPSHVP